MLLTEAVRIVGLLSTAACHATETRSDTDPLLALVCGWRRSSPVQYAELEDLTGAGRPFPFRRVQRMTDRESAATAILGTLQSRGGTWAVDDLLARCQCTRGNLGTTISRLRAAGHVIEWRDGGAQGRYPSGYRLRRPAAA